MQNPYLRILFGLSLSILLFACTKVDEAAQQSQLQAGRISITDIQLGASTSSSPSTGTYQDLSGRSLEIADFAGRKLIVNYWATWCAPCIREIPALSRAAEILGPEGYVVLMASDESLETISAFIAENEFSGNFIKLNSFFAMNGIQAVPSTILFDENGQELNNWLGAYEWDSPEILSEIRSY